MNLDLQVTFTLSDKLFALLEDKLPNLGRRVEKAVSKELGAKVRQESNISISVKPSETEGAAETVEDVPHVSISVKPSEPESPKPVVETPAQQPENAVPSIVDCRAALARCRDRFEGDDKNNKESERYAKYHGAISRQCKLIIMEVSGGTAEKIPDLKDEHRAAFIAAMDALTLDEKGFIAPPQAPY